MKTWTGPYGDKHLAVAGIEWHRGGGWRSLGVRIGWNGVLALSLTCFPALWGQKAGWTLRLRAWPVSLDVGQLTGGQPYAVGCLYAFGRRYPPLEGAGR